MKLSYAREHRLTTDAKGFTEAGQSFGKTFSSSQLTLSQLKTATAVSYRCYVIWAFAIPFYLDHITWIDSGRQWNRRFLG